MRRITVLATAGAATLAVGMISFALGRAIPVREPVASTKIAEPQLVTGTISSRPITAQVQSQASSPPSVAFPPVASTAASLMLDAANSAPTRQACGNAGPLGVARVVEIDTAGGPGFGFEQFKAYDFLRDHEVVLTFDDGPWPGNTLAVLKALADQCTKALFLSLIHI